jgi:DNA polymerase elongation subunit (family B)
MLQFQILSGRAKDVEGAYQVTLFGSTAAGESVSLDVTGFQPYFYIELPEWSVNQRVAYQAYLEADIPGLTFSVEKHKSFWDFTADRLFTFLKVQSVSKRSWTKVRDRCQHPETALPIPYKGQVLRVFEANIDPMLRFFHNRELQPASWVMVAEDQWDEEEAATTTKIKASTDVSQVGPAPNQLATAPLRSMYWDIECTSSHGDFPLAIKTWRKPTRDIVAAGLRDWPAVAAAIRAATAGKGPLSRIFLKPDADLETGLAAVGRAWSRLRWGDDVIDAVDALLTEHLPAIEGDPIIQIGASTYVGDKVLRKDIFVLGSCAAVEGVNVHSCRTEADVIRGWCRLISQIDPDIMVGYNIFGFDDKYVWDRATVNGCNGALRAFSRVAERPVIQEKFLSSSAMGDNTFYIILGTGRLHIDLLAYVRRNAVLDSYSLDNVTATFMSGSVTGPVTVSATNTVSTLWPSATGVATTATIPTKSTKGTTPGRYIVLMDEENDVIGEKVQVVAVTAKSLTVAINAEVAEAIGEMTAVRWAQSKDDVSPKEIFALHAQGPAERARVARYCIQDCDLVKEVFQKLEVLNNSVAMANICWVPVDFIFTRGQGIKSESLVFYECRKEGQLIPVLPAPPNSKFDSTPAADAEIIADDTEGYEGAIVLDPLAGIYLDDEPVAALDFSSLYPSSIISENLSHDSVVWVKDYDLTGRLLGIKEGSDTYDNLPGWSYLEVDYDILKPDPADTRKHPPLKPWGRRVCRYAQPASGKSTLPKILQKLLSQRKATRKEAEKETDDFRKALLDAQQLAYKLTANSLYGQLGSNTSKIRRKCLAASTTGHGRQQLLFSKACVEAAYGPDAGDPRCSAVVVYGDTDSVFISFRPRDPVTGERLTGRAAQAAAKALAEEAGGKISGALKKPHDFEFDKMFRCFCLLSKKRYFGDMTEGGLDDSDYHRKSMGIVMKRRDNAPIVKYVYGGVIERILNQRDIVAAFQFVRQAVTDLLAGSFPLKRLTISKSLRAEYKLVPAHKVLADRIGVRDPGNKPSSNDRIPFVYCLQPSGKPWPKDASQGDRIETPTYMAEKGLKPDFLFYITNQIAKPVAQVFGLVVDRLPEVKPHQLRGLDSAGREKLAEELLFGAALRVARRDAAGLVDIRGFFGKTATQVGNA